MKAPVRDSSTFTFNATDKTVTFSAPVPIAQQHILGVFNVTRQAWLYLPTKAGYGGSYASPVLTVTASTTGHQNTDVLQIFYDDGATTQPTAPNVSRGAGPVDANTQRFTAANDGPLMTSLGAPADPAATTDTGTFSSIALVKRGLTNWTTLLTRIPALVSGRVPVDGSGVTQPVSGTFWQATQPVSAANLPLPSGAATAAKQPALGTAGAPSADVISIQGVSGGTPASVNCIQVYATASFTRPNDTTAYASFDSVSDSTTAPTILTFPNVARANGGSGLIVSARHTKTSSVTTNAAFRLHLYRAAPTAINDNAAFAMLAANTASRIGYIDFSHISGGAGSTASEGAGVFPAGSVLTYVCGAATTSLFGVLTTLAAYPPTANEVHAIELGVQPN